MKTFAVALSLALCAAMATADLSEMKARGTLRVIAAAEEQPETFSFKAESDPGFERELIEGFARLQGLKVEVVAAKSHADRIPMLKAAAGDVIVAIFDTEERRRQVAFTDEVMPTHNVVVTMSPAAPVTRMEELREKRIGVVNGTASVQDALAAGLPASALVRFDGGDAALEALRTGAIDATIRPISEFALSARRVKGLRAGMVVGPMGKVAWGVRREDVQLLRALDDYLGNARRAATWNRLLVKYFGDQALDVLGRKP